MVVNKDDKRVKRTKKAIRDALMRLMQDKSLAHVTTTELCREADVNRNTFYAHYASPEDVLAEVEEEVLAEVSEMLENNYEEGGVTLAMCKAIDENRDRWRAVWQGNPRLLEHALDLCCDKTLEHWNAEGVRNMERGILFLQFITRGASGVVGNWLDDGCRMPPEEMSALIESFVFNGQKALTPQASQPPQQPPQ